MVPRCNQPTNARLDAIMSKTSYRNPWHKEGRPEFGPAFYQTDVKADEYRGYLIYHRTMSVWDIVKDGSCVTQRAGVNGARQAIDELTVSPTERKTAP
jgi:hypothetical protein